jgi:hypothetical protein
MDKKFEEEDSSTKGERERKQGKQKKKDVHWEAETYF